MNKKVIALLCIATLIGGVFLVNKQKDNEFYKEIPNENQENSNDNVEENKEENSDIVSEKITYEDNEISESDIENTKEIGLKFIPLVHSYDLENGHESDVIEATKYSTEGMKSLLIGAFIETKQPILFENFFARKVKEVRAIEPYVEKDSITWKYGVDSNILNRNGELINEENNRVMLMFVKENGEWRVGDYATTQYR